MAIENFEKCVKRICIFQQGLNTNTRYGLSQQTYNAWLKSKSFDSKLISQITTEEAYLIYKEQFWDPIIGDELSPGLDMILFDIAVHIDSYIAIKFLQKALGLEKIDGIIGLHTKASIMSRQDGSNITLIEDLNLLRLRFYWALKTNKQYGQAWKIRAQKTLEMAKNDYMGFNSPKPVYIPNGEIRARQSDARKPLSIGFADATTGGGTVTTLLTQTTSILSPYNTNNKINLFINSLTILGGVMVLFGLAYRIIVQKQTANILEALAQQ